MDNIIVEYVVIAISVILAGGTFTATLPSIYKARVNQQMNKFNPLVYVAMYGHCLGWILWSLFQEEVNVFVLFLCIYGLLLAIWQISTTYQLTTSAKVKVLVEIGLMCQSFIMLVYLYVALQLSKMNERHLFLGVIANLHQMMFYGIPCLMMIRIIKEKNSVYIYWPLALVMLVNSFFWLFWGLMIKDVLFWSPNIIGILLNSTQLFLAWYYPRKIIIDDNDNNDNGNDENNNKNNNIIIVKKDIEAGDGFNCLCEYDHDDRKSMSLDCTCGSLDSVSIVDNLIMGEKKGYSNKKMNYNTIVCENITIVDDDEIENFERHS
eukprot:Pgem_evm1s6223